MSFWQPQHSEANPRLFKLTATPACCVGQSGEQFFMGGVAMAAAVEAADGVPH